MGLDIRLPLGLIFLITGGIMAIYGLVTRGSDIYQRSENINVNLIWGVLMILFGAVMFFVGRRQKWQDDAANPRPWEREEGAAPRRGGH